MSISGRPQNAMKPFVGRSSVPRNMPRGVDGAHRKQAQSVKQVSVLVDGTHLFQTAYTLKIKIDHQKLLSALLGGDTLHAAYFYSGFYKHNQKQTRFLAQLKDIGYRVLAKEIAVESVEQRSIGFTAEMVPEMIAQAAVVDSIILVSGDDKLAEAQPHVSRQGASIDLVSLGVATDDRLLQAADTHTDLAALKDLIKRSEAA